MTASDVLFADVGNTASKLYRIAGGRPVLTTAIASSPDAWREYFSGLRKEKTFPKRIALSSVVASVTETIVREAAREQTPVFQPDPQRDFSFSMGSVLGVGIDRLLAIEGALSVAPAPLIAVCVGTAVTFTALSVDRVVVGGIIAPGYSLSMHALIEHAPALAMPDLNLEATSIGQSTDEALRAGALVAWAALIEGCCDRITKQLGTEVSVIIGGGGYKNLAPLLRMPHIPLEHLVAVGLSRVLNTSPALPFSD